MRLLNILLFQCSVYMCCLKRVQIMEHYFFQKLVRLYLLLPACSMQLSATHYLYFQLLHKVSFALLHVLVAYCCYHQGAVIL